jgi:hypothetical protein
VARLSSEQMIETVIAGIDGLYIEPAWIACEISRHFKCAVTFACPLLRTLPVHSLNPRLLMVIS